MAHNQLGGAAPFEFTSLPDELQAHVARHVPRDDKLSLALSGSGGSRAIFATTPRNLPRGKTPLNTSIESAFRSLDHLRQAVRADAPPEILMKSAIEKRSVVFLDTLFGEGVRPTEDHALLALRLEYHDIFSWMLTTGIVPGPRLIERVCLDGLTVTGAEFTTCVERFFSVAQNHTAFDRYEKSALVISLVRGKLFDRALSLCRRYSSGNRKWGHSLISPYHSPMLWDEIVDTDNSDFVRDMLSVAFTEGDNDATFLLDSPVERDKVQSFAATWAFFNRVFEQSYESQVRLIRDSLSSPRVLVFILEHFMDFMPRSITRKFRQYIGAPEYTGLLELLINGRRKETIEALCSLDGEMKLHKKTSTLFGCLQSFSHDNLAMASLLVKLGWPTDIKCLLRACRVPKNPLFAAIYRTLPPLTASELQESIRQEMQFGAHGVQQTLKRRVCLLFGEIAVAVVGSADAQEKDFEDDTETEPESESEVEEEEEEQGGEEGGVAMDVEEEEEEEEL